MHLSKPPLNPPVCTDVSVALEELEDFLKLRIEAAYNKDFSSKSVDDIFDEVEQEENT